MLSHPPNFGKLFAAAVALLSTRSVRVTVLVEAANSLRADGDHPERSMPIIYRAELQNGHTGGLDHQLLPFVSTSIRHGAPEGFAGVRLM